MLECQKLFKDLRNKDRPRATTNSGKAWQQYEFISHWIDSFWIRYECKCVCVGVLSWLPHRWVCKCQMGKWNVEMWKCVQNENFNEPKMANSCMTLHFRLGKTLSLMLLVYYFKEKGGVKIGELNTLQDVRYYNDIWGDFGWENLLYPFLRREGIINPKFGNPEQTRSSKDKINLNYKSFSWYPDSCFNLCFKFSPSVDSAIGCIHT